MADAAPTLADPKGRPLMNSAIPRRSGSVSASPCAAMRPPVSRAAWIRSGGMARIASGDGARSTAGLPWQTVQCVWNMAKPDSVPGVRTAAAAAAGSAAPGSLPPHSREAAHRAAPALKAATTRRCATKLLSGAGGRFRDRDDGGDVIDGSDRPRLVSLPGCIIEQHDGSRPEAALFAVRRGHLGHALHDDQVPGARRVVPVLDGSGFETQQHGAR